jgi:DNA primase
MAIPFITTGGVVCVRYRSIDHSEPKYLTRAGDESTLFSVTSLLDDTDTMVITEGEIDAMTLNQMGISAVGVSGAKAWKRHYRLLFEDYERVIVACDGDAAGRDFGRQVTDQIQGATAISMPDGEDVNSVYTTHGEESVRAMLRLI